MEKSKFKRITPDSLPNKLLPVKNAHKIAAATWVIQMVMLNRKVYTVHLANSEAEKVDKEIDRILDRIRTKRRKDAGDR